MKKFLLICLAFVTLCAHQQLTGMANHAYHIRMPQQTLSKLAYVLLSPLINSKQLLREAYYLLFHAHIIQFVPTIEQKTCCIICEHATQTNEPYTAENTLIRQYGEILSSEKLEREILEQAQQAEKERQEKLLQEKIALRNAQRTSLQ